MLRAVLGALIVANLVFFAFTRGWLDSVGLRSQGDREPERLAAQVRPGSIGLLAVAPAADASAPAGGCYETPAFNAVDALAAETALRAQLPPGRWSEERVDGAASAAAAGRIFRVTAADAVLAARLTSLKLDAAGRGFSACSGASPRR